MTEEKDPKPAELQEEPLREEPAEDESGEDFEALFLASERQLKTHLAVGDAVQGTLIHRSKDAWHVDVGTRSEAVCPLSDDDRFQEFVVGATRTFYVQRTGYEVRLSLDPLVGHGDFSVLRSAHEAGTGVSGKVIGVNKGGFEVNVAGVTCFCPLSHLTVEPLEGDPKKYLGRLAEFAILELQEDSAVLSHRVLMRQRQDAQRQSALDALSVGKTVVGHVVEITPFGAFLDLDGVRGLLHISEMAHHRIQNPREAVSEGQELEVMVLEMEKDQRGRDRIRLSLKACMPDPWTQLELQPGAAVTCRFVRETDFGLFFELVPGIEGLLPNRFLRRLGEPLNPEDVKNETTELVVVDVSLEERRVTLAIPGWNDRPKSLLQQGERLQAEVVKILPAGLLVQAVSDPAKGLVPSRFLGNLSGKQLAKTYPKGAQVEVVMEEIDERGRFTFALWRPSNDLDSGTLKAYEDRSDLSHNPFADFFKGN